MTERAGGGPHGTPGIDPQDLEAALSVRRELGADYEPALVESFVARIEAAVDARVAARVAAVNVAHALQGRRPR